MPIVTRNPWRFREMVIGMRPVVYWPMGDKGVNPGIFYDWTRQGRDAPNLGGIPANPLMRGDRVGASNNFSGINEVNVADATWHDLTTMTIMMTVVSTGTPTAWSLLLSKGSSSTIAANPYMVRYEATATQLVFQVANNSSSQFLNVGSASQFLDGKPRQFFFTADGSNLRAYVNGTQLTSAAQTITPYNATGVVNMGGAGTWGDLTNTRIQHTALWNRALTAGDVSRLYRTAMS